MQLKLFSILFMHILQSVTWGIMELGVCKNAVPFAKRHVTVIMLLVTVKRAAKLVGKEPIA